MLIINNDFLYQFLLTITTMVPEMHSKDTSHPQCASRATMTAIPIANKGTTAMKRTEMTMKKVEMMMTKKGETAMAKKGETATAKKGEMAGKKMETATTRKAELAVTKKRQTAREKMETAMKKSMATSQALQHQQKPQPQLKQPLPPKMRQGARE
jgi:hypothetical protein